MTSAAALAMAQSVPSADRSAAGSAQAYPVKPVRVVVPFPAGSGSDQVARVLASQAAETLGHPFIVDNRPGALGSIGSAEVAKAAPDGYTLVHATNTTHAANVALLKTLAYDPAKDFAPIIRVTTVPVVLVTRPDFPAKTVNEFIDYAVSKSGQLTAGYFSAGSQVPIAKLRTLGKFTTVDVPYKGPPPAMSDLMGGHIAFSFADLTIALPLMQAGKLKGYAVTSLQRSPFASELPAFAEQFPGFEVILWNGWAAPAATPRQIVDKLHAAVSKGLATRDTKARLASLWLNVEPLNPDQFSDYIRKEIVKWSRDAKEAGIKPE
jgi:tripartite-type tricarboxylate transporter receptor subunit TctC